VAKKIVVIILGVSWILWSIFQFTPALDAVPPGPAFIITVVFMLIALISIGILIGMAVRDYDERPR